MRSSSRSTSTTSTRRWSSGEPARRQVAVPKMAVPGIGWLAYAKDPDGNIFGMMQADPEAA